MKTITINGMNFQLIKPRNEVEPFTGWMCDEREIFMCYKCPSVYKIEIWNSWLKWARETDGVYGFEISSHNPMTFTITGGYLDEDGNEYVLYITKSYNRAYLVHYY